MSLLRKVISTLFLSFSLFFFLAPSQSLANTPIPDNTADKNPIAGMLDNWPKNNPWSLAKEFCDKRSGELMNLETWFSGKCGDDTYTLSGEGVGFVDIIQLQAMEWIFSPQYKSLPEQILELIQGLGALKEALSIDEYNKKASELSQLEINKGLLPQLSSIIQKTITTKPASSTEYIAYVSKNLKDKNIVKDSYAAETGYGFTSLSPLLPIWKAFRNIAYMLFAIAFVIYGIMIMFRIRIDSKTAATIQLAIPKLVTTLLLITFSYAIVGLLVDISTVMSALLIDVLRVGGLIDGTFNNHVLVKAAGGNALGAVGSFAVNFISSMLVAPFIVFNLLVGGILGAAMSAVAAFANIFTGIGVILTIVIFLSVGFAYVKLILKLFQSYFSVIIYLIFSPIILLGNILPGSTSFQSWFMNIAGNLAVFPAASFLLTLSYVLIVQPLITFVNLFGGAGIQITGGAESLFGVKSLTEGFSSIWSPALTLPTHLDSTANANSFIGNPLGGLMLATIGIGLLLMSSKYVDMILEALKVPPFKYGAAIGEALKYGSGRVGKMNPENIPNLVPIPNSTLRGYRDNIKGWSVGQLANAGGGKTTEEKSTI